MQEASDLARRINDNVSIPGRTCIGLGERWDSGRAQLVAAAFNEVLLDAGDEMLRGAATSILGVC